MNEFFDLILDEENQIFTRLNLKTNMFCEHDFFYDYEGHSDSP